MADKTSTSTTVLTTLAATHYLDRLNNRASDRTTFRAALDGVTTLLVARCLELLDDPPEVVFVPIIRGGLAMVDGAIVASPNGSVGHIGLYREPTTHDIIEYYSRIPSNEGATAIILDPMIATGGTAIAAADAARRAGCSSVAIVTVVIAKDGVEAIEESNFVSHILSCKIDQDSPKVGALANGLGDAGSRLFGAP